MIGPQNRSPVYFQTSWLPYSTASYSMILYLYWFLCFITNIKVARMKKKNSDQTRDYRTISPTPEIFSHSLTFIFAMQRSANARMSHSPCRECAAFPWFHCDQVLLWETKMSLLFCWIFLLKKCSVSLRALTILAVVCSKCKHIPEENLPLPALFWSQHVATKGAIRLNYFFFVLQNTSK